MRWEGVLNVGRSSYLDLYFMTLYVETAQFIRKRTIAATANVTHSLFGALLYVPLSIE